MKRCPFQSSHPSWVFLFLSSRVMVGLFVFLSSSSWLIITSFVLAILWYYLPVTHSLRLPPPSAPFFLQKATWDRALVWEHFARREAHGLSLLPVQCCVVLWGTVWVLTFSEDVYQKYFMKWNVLNLFKIFYKNIVAHTKYDMPVTQHNKTILAKFGGW